VHRSARREQRRPGVAVAAGQQAEHAPAVLVRFGSWAGQQRADVVPLRGRGVRLVRQVRRQADIDQFHGARVARARVDQQPGLERPEGHGDVGPDGGAVHGPGVGVDAARQVDRDHGGAVWRARSARAARPANGSRSPPRPPIPSSPSMIRSAWPIGSAWPAVLAWPVMVVWLAVLVWLVTRPPARAAR